MAIYVGLDWASDHHDVYVTNDQSQKVGAFRIEHTVEGLATLQQRLPEYGGQTTDVRIALERPDGLVVASLLDGGYAVYPINPKSVDRYRDRYHTSGAKDDARDALVLAHILRTDGDRYQPLQQEGEIAAELRVTIRAYRDLVTESTRLTNQLRACLSDYYPVALGLFHALDQPITLAFLAAYPTPDAARTAGPKRLATWCRRQRYSQEERIAALVAQVQLPALTAPAGVVRARSRQLQGLVAALGAVVAAKQAHEHALEDLLGKHPDGGLFLALPGAGVVTAAALLGELGEDRTRFRSSADLQAVSGTAPVTIQSGKSRRVVRRQGCSRQVRETRVQFAYTSHMRAACGDMRAAWVQEAYDACRAAGKSSQHAYRIIANRWATILWAMWSRHEAYDPHRYDQARRSRTVPKAS